MCLVNPFSPHRTYSCAHMSHTGTIYITHAHLTAHITHDTHQTIHSVHTLRMYSRAHTYTHHTHHMHAHGLVHTQHTTHTHHTNTHHTHKHTSHVDTHHAHAHTHKLAHMHSSACEISEMGVGRALVRAHAGCKGSQEPENLTCLVHLGKNPFLDLSFC